jgi:hypothetical protein
MESCASSCTDSHCSTTIKREMKEDRMISLRIPLVEECDLFQGTIERDYKAELDVVQVTANEHHAPNRTSLDMLEICWKCFTPGAKSDAVFWDKQVWLPWLCKDLGGNFSSTVQKD